MYIHVYRHIWGVPLAYLQRGSLFASDIRITHQAKITTSSGSRMFYSRGWKGQLSCWNTVTMVTATYPDNTQVSYACDTLFFIEVTSWRFIGQRLLFACARLRELKNMRLKYPGAGSLRILEPTNMYVRKDSRVRNNVIVPIDEIGSKLAIVQEGRHTYYFEYDSRVHSR